MEMNIQEIEAVGLDDTTQEMVTSCPETELYVFCWMFTVGPPEMYFALCWFILLSGSNHKHSLQHVSKQIIKHF